MHKDPIELQGGKFIGWWVCSSIFVYPLAIIVAYIMMIPGSIVYHFLQSFIRPVSYTSHMLLMYAGFITIIGTGIGYSMGILQRSRLRQNLFWTADKWVRYSIIGGIVGALVSTGTSEIAATYFFPGHYNTPPISIMMPTFVLFVSAAQWLSLRHAVKHAWLWIVINVIAGLIYMRLLSPFALESPDMPWWLMLAAFVQGFITATMMLWLFEKHAYPVDYADPADDTHPAEGKNPSVWDNAI